MAYPESDRLNLSTRYLWLAASLVLFYLLPADWLELQRRAVLDSTEIESAEIWRLVTAHWSHVGVVHLVLNVLGVLVMASLFPSKEGWRGWLLCLAGIALAVSLTLLVMLPELAWYRGFSGCLYGLFIYESIRHLKAQPVTAGAVLVLVAAKLVIDGLGLGGSGTATLIGAPVIGTAHVAGALAGAGLAVCHCGYGRSGALHPSASERE